MADEQAIKTIREAAELIIALTSGPHPPAAAPQATDPRDAEIERLKGELILAKASAEAAGSLLLDVQKDCIAERQGRLAAEARLSTLTADKGKP